MLFSIFAGWIAGLKLEKTNHAVSRKRFLLFSVSFHLAVLFVFKYLSFIASQLGLLLHRDFSSINIVLPIGISFFTFQILSYVFDVYYGYTKPQKNLLHLGLYISLFPQLIAGPIVRYTQIEEQILNRRESVDIIADGMMRFIYGLGKKVIIADYVSVIADNIFNPSMSLSVMTAWLGAIAYTLQIYFDFSGYSDMAIGLGRMFGFTFRENFNYPYICKSATEFWQRWHISLGSWFRDYVYIPMGGNRVSKRRWVLNLFIVWLLTGIWHGANWTFLFWGLFYFILLLIEKLTDFPQKIGVLARLYAMVVIILGWTMFRSETISKGIHYIGMMFGYTFIGFTDNVSEFYIKNGGGMILLLSFIFTMPLIPLLRKKEIWNKIEPFVALCILVLSLLLTVTSTYSPFIYFNF